MAELSLDNYYLQNTIAAAEFPLIVNNPLLSRESATESYNGIRRRFFSLVKLVAQGRVSIDIGISHRMGLLNRKIF